MIQEYLDKFGSLILNPLVFLGVIFGFVFINANKYNLKLRWILLGLLAMVASFAEYRDQFVPDPPDLITPLEQIRAFGRPIAILLLLVLLIFTVWYTRGSEKIRDRFYIRRGLLTIQLLIFSKNLLYGDTVTAVLTFFTFFLVYSLFNQGVSRWIVSVENFRYIATGFVTAVIVFLLMGVTQVSVDPYPMFFQQNRYLGMTGNPQHAAVLLASAIPFFLFRIIHLRIPHFRLLFVGFLLLALYYLFLTGSRTGALLAIVSMGIFIVGYRSASIKYIVPIIIIIVGVTYINIDLSDQVDQRTLSRYTDPTNTRARVFQEQIDDFNNYPLFGVPVRGDRMGFTENSYGAIAAALGLIGLLPLLLMVRGLILLCRTLWKKSQETTDQNKHYYLMVVSGIVALMVGAFLEAYLVGNLTWPLITLLTYVAMGYYLLELKTQKDASTAVPKPHYHYS